MTNTLFKLAVLFLITSASCSAPCRQWNYTELDSCGYQSRRIVLYPENDFRGLQLEFVKTLSGRRAFLKIHSLSFPRHQDDSGLTSIVLSWDGGLMEFQAIRLDGGQCLLLPQDALDCIIHRLLQNSPLTVSVGRYKSDIVPRGFSAAYREFKKPLHQMGGM